MQIAEIMVPDPIWVMEYDLVHTAKRKMAENRIKHLPVLDGDERVAGIVSDRDLKMYQAISDNPAFHQSARVAEVSRKFPYCVSPETPATEVLLYMLQERIGSALVTSGGQLLGIFTSMDACRVLAERLEADRVADLT